MGNSKIIHEMHYEIALSDVSKKITNYIFSQFERHYNDIVDNFSSISIEDRKIYEEELKSEILTKNLNHYVYVLLAKCNCRCLQPNTIYCYSMNCENNKLTPIINSNNFNASALNHKKRNDKHQQKKRADKKGNDSFLVKDTLVFKEDNQFYYVRNGIKKMIFFENILSKKFKEKSLNAIDRMAIENNLLNKHNEIDSKSISNEILLFDQNIIKNVYEIILCESFKKEENEKLKDLIKESIFDKILLDSKMKALHNLFEIGLSIFPPDANKFKDLEKKTNNYIDTTYGAGLYYLENIKPSGYVSVEAVKEAFASLFKKEVDPKSKIKIKFTNDHIYRRKLAATYLKNEHQRDFSEFKKLYKNRFSYISFITSKENSSIKKWDENPNSMKIPFDKFREIYVLELKKLNVNLIETEIFSETQMKTFIEFIYITEVSKLTDLNEKTIKNIDEISIKEWFSHYQNLINLFEI